MEDIKLVKELAFGEDARSKVLTGVNKLTNAVSSTLGASGKCLCNITRSFRKYWSNPY